MNAYKQDCSNSMDSDSKSSSLNSRGKEEVRREKMIFCFNLISLVFIFPQPTKDTNFAYLPGEVCQDVKNDVTYICPYSGPKKGTFTITNYRLHFRSTSDRDIQMLVDVPSGVVSFTSSTSPPLTTSNH